MIDNLLYKFRIRYAITVLTGLTISRTSFRFDKTWRHAEFGPKAWFCRACCTFAANYIVDEPKRQIKHWQAYL